MKITRNHLMAMMLTAMMPMTAIAETDIEALKRKVELLEQQLSAIKGQIAAQEKETKALKTDVKAATKEQKEWTSAESVVHLAGYGSVGYTDNKNASGRFSQVQFSPIFHYQYKDLVMLESELEITNTPDGETELDLEYMALDLFLHDNATLVAGKFLSPIGQFRQNLHPGWINKMPSAPPGFGHDGAAPVSETGLQVRGGFPMGGLRANYAVYASNGPELEAVTEGADVELEGIHAEGRTSNVDGSLAWGGRLGLLPQPNLEVGLSMATGKAAVTTFDGAEISDQPKRSYGVLGADLTWHWGAWDVRGEFVQSKIGGDSSASATASESAKWRSWYTQVAHPLYIPKIEGVVRYTNFDAPGNMADQEQWAVGLDYLFASNLVGKAAYEFNKGEPGSDANQDSLLLQLSYGF